MEPAPTLQKTQIMSFTSKLRVYDVCSIYQAQQKRNVLEDRNTEDSSYLGRYVALRVNNYNLKDSKVKVKGKGKGKV
jgi:hypothetical protein